MTATINSYYTAALAPAVAALCGIGAAQAWTHRSTAQVRVAVGAEVIATAGYGTALLWGAEADPTWLLPTLVAVALAALVLVAIRVERVGLGVAAVTILLVPATASVSLVLRGYGAFDTPFESTMTARGVDQLFVATPALVARALPALERARAGAPDLLAVQSSAVASVFAYPTGQEVLPIGGFTGTQAPADAGRAARRHRARRLPPGARVPEPRPAAGLDRHPLLAAERLRAPAARLLLRTR